MAKFNLTSPTGLVSPCQVSDLNGWLAIELSAIHPESVRHVVNIVCKNINDFVSWPREAVLLWDGCDRVTPTGKSQRIHRYPPELKKAASPFADWDTRPNGPAIAAFIVAGGIRPKRKGSSNSWSIHHLYSGKFPHQKEIETTHASKSGVHFTQSAGLVAIHPIADQMCDEFPFFSWLLRALSFQKFGYDPDSIFDRGKHDHYGFVAGRSCRIVHSITAEMEIRIEVSNPEGPRQAV